MLVIKLGGSMMTLPILKAWLELISIQGAGNTVIVPGGGKFADQVRAAQLQWQFSDAVAHHMAILAMQQMALLCYGINRQLHIARTPEAIVKSLLQNKAVIWSPEIHSLNESGIPASWDITSDSLSAWLADKISASTLALVKSAEIPFSYTVSQLVEKGIIDRGFLEFTAKTDYLIKCFNVKEVSQFSFFLRDFEN